MQQHGTASDIAALRFMPVLHDHAKVSYRTLEAELEALARIKKTQLLRESIDRKKAASTCALDRLFDKVDDVGVPTALALVLNAVKDPHVRIITSYDLQSALFDAGKHDLCAMVKSWRVGEEARSDEEKKERYREIAAKRLASERLAAHMNVERLAAHLQRVDDRDFAKSFRAYMAQGNLEYWRVKDMKAAKLPPEPPVVLERKALNQLDKRAKTRKLAGPKEAKDENEHRQHREKKEQQELRNAQTKARNQKRAKARADKLAA